ncbi:MAG: DUF1330 domain-containing protein, partial [Pseudomonadota bacterium]
LAVYRERAGDALSAHGGAAVAGGPAAEALEGAPEGLYVLLRFPAAEAARAWIKNPDLAEVHALRREAAEVTTMLLPPL